MDKIKKALEAIEGLTILWEDGDKTGKRAKPLMDDIYRFSHIAIGNCENPHKDWWEDLDKTYKELKEGKII
jgi:hypothetical protein